MGRRVEEPGPSHNRGNAQCVFHDVKPLCVCCVSPTVTAAVYWKRG